MFTIKNIHAREILDSRGNPTVEVEIFLEDGSFGRAAVPSGASTGSHEAHELRDNDNRYHGKGVKKAVSNINNEITNLFVGKTFTQQELDTVLIEADGTPNKSRLGANAILGVSLAFARASSSSSHVPLFQHIHDISGISDEPSLPTPMMNILNGGAHADGVDFQEYMIIPAGISSFKEKLRAGSEIFHTLKSILKDEGHITAVGDEGGYAPKLSSNKEGFEIIVRAIEQSGYSPGEQVYLGLDAAANEFYKDGSYELRCEQTVLSADELISYYKELCSLFPIISIEDGLAEDDWNGFRTMTKVMGDTVQIVGDDLFVTNLQRLQKGIDEGAGNAILIKPNQIGTLTESIDAVKRAQEHNFGTIMSHRSGETEDSTIAHLAVGLSTKQIKTGSLSRSDRTAKYNQLLRIEEQL